MSLVRTGPAEANCTRARACTKSQRISAVLKGTLEVEICGGCGFFQTSFLSGYRAVLYISSMIPLSMRSTLLMFRICTILHELNVERRIWGNLNRDNLRAGELTALRLTKRSGRRFMTCLLGPGSNSLPRSLPRNSLLARSRGLRGSVRKSAFFGQRPLLRSSEQNT